MSKTLFHPCTACGKAEGVWILRANTQTLCDQCKRNLEWHSENPNGFSPKG